LHELTVSFLAADGKAPKCLDQTTDGRTRTCRPPTSRERGGSSQNQIVPWRDRCPAVWRAALARSHADHFWTHPR
jgi:hypothetical protein